MVDSHDAISVLQELGLSEYEAKCFVALAHLPQGTAKDVSRLADVPRSRVYGALDRLSRKGLVDIQRSKPKVFQAVEIDTALHLLRKRYDTYFDTLEESLRDIEPAYKETDRAVWAIEHHENVTERTLALIEEAEEELVLLIFNDAILDDEMLSSLQQASDTGVSIHVGTVTDEIHQQLSVEVPGMTVFSSALLEWVSDTPENHGLGRVVMSDREAVLVSSIWGEPVLGFPDETAVWTAGVDHGFSVFVRNILTYELETSKA
ncbi:TrmB family transcriptional regulator [Halegenticoccus tardaugens]|uniref:TrmB family transcriptional regulator n=1 Tax=Halegenticoccus tardaugens TaxID=2071624 RepID=UPI00100BDDCD|nr:helix-turn-helix domain-containing protein [Halegenticoccus tardaugens]